MNSGNTIFNSSSPEIYQIQTNAAGPTGSLPLTEEILLNSPSGDIFGLSQNAGMGWNPAEAGRKQFLILSTQGGLRAPDGKPIALGYHTGHWEIGLLVQAAAEEFSKLKTIPFAGFCSDPCDGRTQGTTGMFDSLPYRNDAAVIFRRLARSLPLRAGVLGIATCDKGLPAMMMAVAGLRDLPCVVVPGGVTLPPSNGEDAGTVQTLGTRFAHGLVSLSEAADLGCRACASPGGGCQFLGTAATAQVVSEALGLSLPHSALAPSGQPVWLDMARRSARALHSLNESKLAMRDILTPASIENAMVLHAAFGGSTNLLLHIPAIAHAAGLKLPTVDDWIAVNRRVPRLVSVLPNGPVHHPTVRVFLAGGVPEVMLHLRRLNLLNTDVLTVTGKTLGENLDWWEASERRSRFRELLRQQDGVDADEVIFAPEQARARGLTSTLVFPRGNLAPEGSVVKATAIDPSAVDADGVYRKEGPARVFVSEKDAMSAIKQGRIQTGDVLVLTGVGPMGTGMEETYQVTGALKRLPFGKHVALLTDARFSGLSTGACIGHIGPEGLAGGPIGKILDGDIIRIHIDRNRNEGSVDLVGEGQRRFTPEEGIQVLARRATRKDLAPNAALPEDTRLWAALQLAGGGTWAGCVYDAQSIMATLEAGRAALAKSPADPTKRFSSRVENYIKYRPGYPKAILDLFKEQFGLTSASIVADIGSGTGIFTELLLKNGSTVFGVEPNREMREAAERLLSKRPAFTSISGTAESTTLKDHSVDIITAGQAFHWFDRVKARQEFLRILKPGGWVVLIWNDRNTTARPFFKAYEDFLVTYSTDYEAVNHKRIDADVIGPFFGAGGFQQAIFPNEQTFDFEGLKGRLLSSSYAPEAGHPKHAPMLNALRAIFHEHQTKGKVTFEYDTTVFYGHLSH